MSKSKKPEKVKIELKRCLYCGGRGEMIKGVFSCWVRCRKCGLTTKQFDNPSEAEDFWNEGWE